MDQTHILLACALLLAAALLLSWNRRINAACSRNVQEAEREALLRIQAAGERLNRSMMAALAAAERLNAASKPARTIALPVKTPKQVDRRPEKKKAAPRR